MEVIVGMVMDFCCCRELHALVMCFFFYLEIMLFHIRWSMCCYCWKDNKTIMSLIWGRHSNFFITVTKIKKKSFNISCGICNVLSEYYWIVAMAIPRCFKIPSQCISSNKHNLKLGNFNSFKWIWQFIKKSCLL